MIYNVFSSLETYYIKSTINKNTFFKSNLNVYIISICFKKLSNSED